jgi:hypothetical protein
MIERIHCCRCVLQMWHMSRQCGKRVCRMAARRMIVSARTWCYYASAHRRHVAASRRRPRGRRRKICLTRQTASTRILRTPTLVIVASTTGRSWRDTCDLGLISTTINKVVDTIIRRDTIQVICQIDCPCLARKSDFPIFILNFCLPQGVSACGALWRASLA